MRFVLRFCALLSACVLGLVTISPASAYAVPALRLPSAAPDTSKAATVLSVAASLAGSPYVGGGTSPAGFDCSGFTRFVYARVGLALVHSSAAQYAASTKISRADVQPGDLVFFRSGARIYHVAIYAGGGQIWHAPRTGEAVSLERIWTSDWVAGRVL